MLNNNIKCGKNLSFFESFHKTSSNLLNLPDEIKSSKQFCLWKYKHTKNSNKPLKIPYGYFKKQKEVIPSLKNQSYWFTFAEYLAFKNFVQGFNLGLILTDGPLTVIDIDNYQYHKTLDSILCKMLKQGAYIEVSPSGQGLHIFYKGKWPYSRKKSIISIGNQAIKMTCEVYCGDDIRFVTLTGQSIVLKTKVDYKPLVGLSNLKRQVEDLAQLFFGYDVFGDIYDSHKEKKVYLNRSNLNNAELIVDISQDYLQIKEKILASNWKQQYCNLCNDMNTGYKSVSEADWAFLLIVSRFIKYNVKYKKQILEFFFQKDRPYRPKKNRSDYFYRTINKVLSSSIIANQNSKSSLYCDSNEKLQYTCINKNTVFKVCNIMKMFHLGRSVKNSQYVYNGKNNYIKVSNPLSLNHNDFVYYIAILQQFAEYINVQHRIISENDYIEINIRKILKSLSQYDSGRSYERFMDVVKKLACTTIEYDKLINVNGLRSKKVGSLLTYEYKYYKSVSIDNGLLYKKLQIKMHPSIIDILTEAQYNYSIFNYTSFLNIKSNELKLLYYYFCLSALPGSYNYKFSFNDLLKFWPKSQNRSTLFKRKQILYDLLDQFCHIQNSIPDIKISLDKREDVIVNVVVKKKQLKLS